MTTLRLLLPLSLLLVVLTPALSRAQSIETPAAAPTTTSSVPKYAGLLVGSLALGAGAYFGGRAIESHPVADAIKPVNLGLRFGLELAALGALGYWGVHTGRNTFEKVALGVGTPLVAAVVWGAFIAPNATYRANGVLNPALQVVVFGSATAALIHSGHENWALAFALSVITNSALMYAWKQ